MERYTYFDGGKWRMRVGDTEYSGKETVRLAAYEDTGLEPEDMKRAFNEDAILKLAGQALGMSPDRLRELAQAKKEGRLVVLPCKVGDTVYIIHNRAIRKTTVESIHQWSSGHWKLSVHTDKKYIHWTGYEVHFERFGKTVFLTREAAEAALKERDAEHDR